MFNSHYRRVIALLMFTFWSSLSQADFELGLNYYQAGDFENAYKAFYDVAQYGDHDAQNNIGVMYFRGEYQPKNLVSAYAWLALAAQDDTINQAGLHHKVLAKLSPPDQQQAKAEHQKLVAHYGDQAIEQKLMPVYTGTNLSVQNQRAIKRVAPRYPNAMLEQHASGFVDMIFSIDKQGLTRDHIATYAASKTFEKAAIEALRQFQFEPMKVDGKPVDVNGLRTRFKFEIEGTRYNKKKLEKEVTALREKADAGTERDKLGFAYFLEVIPSFAGDYALKDNPNEWYLKAAHQGSGAASYFLGRNILYGNMCTQDNAQSMGWLLKAAKQGVVDAQYMLAIESFSGARFEKNETKGFYWLARAAAASPAAKLRYAWILSTHPDSKRRNGKQASEYLAQVDKNHLDRQTYLKTQAAVAAENGDFKQAIKWQKEALKDAQQLELPEQYLTQQLASYSAKQPWREDI